VVSGVGMGISNIFGGNKQPAQPAQPAQAAPSRTSRRGTVVNTTAQGGKPQGPVEQGPATQSPRAPVSRRPTAFDNARTEAQANGQFTNTPAPPALSPFDQILADSANQAAQDTGTTAPGQQALTDILNGSSTPNSFAGGSNTFQETGVGQQLAPVDVPINAPLVTGGPSGTPQPTGQPEQPPQPGQTTQTDLSPNGSSVTAGQSPQEGGFNQAFLSSLVANLQDAAMNGSLPFSVALPGQDGQAGGQTGQGQQGATQGQAGQGGQGQGQQGQGQQGQGGAGGAGQDNIQNGGTFNTPTNNNPRRSGTTPFRAPSTPAQSAAQLEATAAVARQGGRVTDTGKPIAGFRPIVDSAGNPITLAPRGDTAAGTTDVQNIFDSFPVLKDFVDPIAFSVDSPFLGQFDLRQSDLEGQRLVTVPQVDANGNVIPGSTATIFANPTTQRQMDFNLAAQPEDTQRAFFAAQVGNSGLAQTLRQANPPEQQPDPFQTFLNGFIGNLAGGGAGGGGGPAQPAVNESLGPPAFPGGPPTRVTEAAPLTPADIGSGVDVGGALGGTTGLLQGQQQNPDLAALLSQLLGSSQPLGA